jgi:hypothetical protein
MNAALYNLLALILVIMGLLLVVVEKEVKRVGAMRVPERGQNGLEQR